MKAVESEFMKAEIEESFDIWLSLVSKVGLPSTGEVAEILGHSRPARTRRGRIDGLDRRPL
jgi:hypothetical protein